MTTTLSWALQQVAAVLEGALPHVAPGPSTRGPQVASPAQGPAAGVATGTCLGGCWFLTPHHHVCEYLLTNAVLLPGLLYLARRYQWEVEEVSAPLLGCGVVTTASSGTGREDRLGAKPPANFKDQRHTQHSQAANPGGPGLARSDASERSHLRAAASLPLARSTSASQHPASGSTRARAPGSKALLLDVLLALTTTVVVGCLVAIVGYKVASGPGRRLYLLQPCHLLNTLLAIVLVASYRRRPGGRAGSGSPPQTRSWADDCLLSIGFNVYLHNALGPWLALLQPGTVACVAIGVCARGFPP
jgi:hypothetical protein